MSASHCDECRNGKLFWYSYRGGEPFDVMKCDKGHKPRFYKQRHDNPLDTNYGWKRTCGDFQRRGLLTHNVQIEPPSRLLAKVGSNAGLGIVPGKD